MLSPLADACSQFEQVFLASLVPHSMTAFGTDKIGESADDASEDFFAESDAAGALLAQTFAAALERAGGLGLAGELYRALSERRQ